MVRGVRGYRARPRLSYLGIYLVKVGPALAAFVYQFERIQRGSVPRLFLQDVLATLLRHLVLCK